MERIRQMAPWYGEEEKEAVANYLDSGGFLTEFKKTRELEKMIADYVGSKYCDIVSNGTVSLFCALKAIESNYPGDDIHVIVPDYTMIASATAINLAGMKPEFVDVEPTNYCVDLASLRKKIQSLRGEKAILMLVSNNGRYPPDIDDLLDFCRDEDIEVVEDAAQSLGSRHKSFHVGTAGLIGSFSFSTPKIITMGQGGALVTNSDDMHEYIKLIKNFGRPVDGVDNHEFLGWNFKITDLQAVIGIEQMKKLPWRVNRKLEIQAEFAELLQGVKGIRVRPADGYLPWMIDAFVEDQTKFISDMNKENIGVRQFYPAIHTQRPYRWVKGDFKVSEYASKYGVWLPSSTFLSDGSIELICDTIKRVLK